jgi:hypothetical protein
MDSTSVSLHLCKVGRADFACVLSIKNSNILSSVAKPEPGARNDVIKLPPVAGAIITNYGSGSVTLEKTLSSENRL